jgi:oligopeptide transport system substrate-binding protein
MSRKFVLAATLLLVLSMVLSSCKPAEKLAKELNMNHGTEPPTIDPNLATDTTSVQCDFLFFMGLTKLNITTVVPEPSLATEWSVSADGLTWTFKLRKDLNWVKWDPATQKDRARHRLQRQACR